MTSIYNSFSLALITGAGSGLGRTLARNFIAHGKRVIIAGRTESNLQETKQELGAACIGYYVIDVADTEALPGFASKLLAENPDLDCLINNAGVSHVLDFKNAGISTKDNEYEIRINIISVTMLCNLFSKHLQSKPTSVLANFSSGLSYVPTGSMPVYCATKSFVSSFTRSLRVQLKDTSVKVVEICPPLVDSNLHRHDPDPSIFESSKNPLAITQKQFMDEVEAGLESGNVEVGAGFALDRMNLWQDTFGPYWKKLNGM